MYLFFFYFLLLTAPIDNQVDSSPNKSSSFSSSSSASSSLSSASISASSPSSSFSSSSISSSLSSSLSSSSSSSSLSSPSSSSSSSSFLSSFLSSPQLSSGSKPSIILTTLRPYLISNSGSYLSSSSSSSSLSTIRTHNKRPYLKNNSSRRHNFNKSETHQSRYNYDSWNGLNSNKVNNHRDSNDNNNNDNESISVNKNETILRHDFGGTSDYVSTSSISPPYWWRPHLNKLPSLRHNSDLPRSDQGWNPRASIDPGYTSDREAKKSGAWLIVIGSGLAVGVACIIVCALFACTNYLFFPPRRKEQISK